MRLDPHDDRWVEEMFRAGFSVRAVHSVLPEASRSALYRKRRNLFTFGAVSRPKEACVPSGRRQLITPEMEDWIVDLLAQKGDIWQEELIYELFHEFNVVVSQAVISRFMQRIRFSKKVNTRIAAQRDQAARDAFEVTVRQYEAEQLLYVDESSVSEKTLFRRYGWSAIGLPAYTRSALRRGTRCSVLPAYSVDGYIPGATLVVEGSVTAAIFEDWLEHRVLPYCEPFPRRRSVIVMDNCSTHHGDRVQQLCDKAGVRLLYLPAYSPDYNPIELSFHLLKQWLRRYRDLAPQWGCEGYRELWMEHLRGACNEWGTYVNHRVLFKKARVRVETGVDDD